MCVDGDNARGNLHRRTLRAGRGGSLWAAARVVFRPRRRPTAPIWHVHFSFVFCRELMLVVAIPGLGYDVSPFLAFLSSRGPVSIKMSKPRGCVAQASDTALRKANHDECLPFFLSLCSQRTMPVFCISFLPCLSSLTLSQGTIDKAEGEAKKK